MTILNSDERLILMDMQVKYEAPHIRLPADDIKALADAGIRTAMMFCTNWGWIEPTQGAYDWSYYDDRVKLLNDCGMKVILQTVTTFPEWMPADWLGRSETGEVIRMPNYYNREAWEYVLLYYRKIRDRYTSPTVEVASSWLTDSETFWPNDFPTYDKYSLAIYQEKYHKMPARCDQDFLDFIKDTQIKMYLDLQNIMADSIHNEIWTAMHPALSPYISNGCLNYGSMASAFRLLHPSATMNHLYCTWVQWGELWPIMRGDAFRFGENMFGGAEYCEGLPTTLPQAMDQGLRGLLINPCHPFTGHERIEPWMLDRIKGAMDIWK